MVSATQPPVPLGRQTLRHLGRTIGSFATSEVGGRAAIAAALLLVLLLAINGLNVINSYVGRDFMTAIERRDGNGFVRMALIYAAVFALLTLAAVVYGFTEQRLGLLWREWLTKRLVGRYLDGRLYYHMQMHVGEMVANPDQRIADDVRAFTTTTLSLVLILLNGTFTLIAFSGVLWTISRPLFVAAVVYAACGSLLTVLLGRPLVRLNYDQADREASFRASLVGVREHAETIAIEQGGRRLEAGLRRQVDAITTNLRRIIAVNRNLSFFTTGYNYMIQLIPALIVAPLFIRGTAEFGVIPQSSMAFAHVLGAFSVIVNQFPMLSSYATTVARLSAMVEVEESSNVDAPSAIAVVDDPHRLAFERLTLHTAHDGRLLVRELSVDLHPGARLLIRGPRDAMAALLRAVAGLWHAGEGRLVRPSSDGIQVLTDDSYVPAASLRELLMAGDGGAEDERVRRALHALDLDGVVQRAGGIDVELERDFLTAEEQRLVEIARLVLAAPAFVVLMRLEACLGPERTAEVLDVLAARGIGYVLLDEELGPEHFDAVVDIAPDGTWTRTVTKGAA